MCFIQFITYFQLRLTEMFVSEEGDDRVNDVDEVSTTEARKKKQKTKNTQNIMQLINNNPI